MNAVAVLARRPRRASCVRGATVASAAPPKRRVVVTGMGCVTSLGHDKTTFYKCVAWCHGAACGALGLMRPTLGP